MKQQMCDVYLKFISTRTRCLRVFLLTQNFVVHNYYLRIFTFSTYSPDSYMPIMTNDHHQESVGTAPAINPENLQNQVNFQILFDCRFANSIYVSRLSSRHLLRVRFRMVASMMRKVRLLKWSTIVIICFLRQSSKISISPELLAIIATRSCRPLMLVKICS